MIGDGAYMPIENAGAVFDKRRKDGGRTLAERGAERDIDRTREQPVGTVGIAGRGEFRTNPTRHLVELWLASDLPDRSAEGAGAIERARRTAQDLDAFQVEDPGIDGLGNRRVVDVEARRVRALDTTKRNGAVRKDSVGGGPERQVGNGHRVVEELRQASFPQVLA